MPKRVKLSSTREQANKAGEPLSYSKWGHDHERENEEKAIFRQDRVTDQSSSKSSSKLHDFFKLRHRVEEMGTTAGLARKLPQRFTHLL